ncbi:MAG TPA: ATPase domain-containing protein, partial [Ignavibacteriales bacterium]|nr:ATPase domain-containing protein [Ignavibacteriales bacterium]
MEQNIQMVSSGMPFIDSHWGGFYKGASYLVVGAKNSGRSLLGLQFAQETIRRNGVCLYFTSMHPAELMKNASSIGFDVEACMKENKLIVVRVADP